jgi:hypothetical protein
MSAADLLSVPEFAKREGVSRVRVLQWLSQGRLAGARRIGHRWAIPADVRVVRRQAGRPGSDRALLRRFAAKYVWWLTPAQALERPELVITQVMELGEYGDVQRLESTLGHAALAQVVRRAVAGRFSARSWTYWHYRLGLAPVGRVPPLPVRRLP